MHFCVCSRFPATLRLASSPLLISWKEQKRRRALRAHNAHVLFLWLSPAPAALARSFCLLSAAMSVPLPCGRISPSYQPGKWKVGGRRFGRQESLLARTHVHAQSSPRLEVLLLGSFPVWFWLRDAPEQPWLPSGWWLRCQGWTEESRWDPSWLLEVIYGNLGNSAGFAANRRCKGGELARASQPSATAGPGVGVISPCAGHAGLLFPLVSLQGSRGCLCTHHRHPGSRNAWRSSFGHPRRRQRHPALRQPRGDFCQGLSLPVVPSRGGFGHVTWLLSLLRTPTGKGSPETVPAGRLAQQGRVITGDIETSPPAVMQVTSRDTQEGTKQCHRAPGGELRAGTLQPSLGTWGSPAAGLINRGKMPLVPGRCSAPSLRHPLALPEPRPWARLVPLVPSRAPSASTAGGPEPEEGGWSPSHVHVCFRPLLTPAILIQTKRLRSVSPPWK